MLLRQTPPLAPTPEEGRSWLQRELAKPEYHDLDIVERILRWIERTFSGRLPSPDDVPWVQTAAALVVFALLLVGLGLLVSRARRSPRVARDRNGDVLTDEALSAAELRERAEAAYAAGDHRTAVVDGFRALARRQVERGRLAEDPGLTALEVAASLEREMSLGGRAGRAAELFDEVLYGDHPATGEQARGVLDLEQELAVSR
ncbi:hypothetical protein GCM10010197_23540 [Nocardioides luteus]|uniref:Protein-glutamine gamma-glutamyltransferase-like C-terminal domain-containing protein n=2 Tax=Nocardioides luteus TaxID=1844 RepID=A0ABQ5SX30_9ACTN|nr:hypothetical protein GCM10010197_23540 [Nocardioides luteus]GLJ68374.1 hypothetical protein GCM10017579_24100 [Nocardioides luteus]